MDILCQPGGYVNRWGESGESPALGGRGGVGPWDRLEKLVGVRVG